MNFSFYEVVLTLLRCHIAHHLNNKVRLKFISHDILPLKYYYSTDMP